MTNKRMIAYVSGILLLLEAALMLLPCGVALIYSDTEGLKPLYSFLITVGISAAAGALLLLLKPKNKTIYSRDGFVIVSLGWIIFSIFGAIPFTVSGDIPNFLDAMFEAVSGFTTTGATILSRPEALSHAVLFWRSFTHWIGGMGVLVFVMALLPLAGGGGDLYLMRAESPGPDVGKLVPHSKDTARILYGIYIGLTVIEAVLLCFGDMSLFDAVTHTFGTAGTGGFGTHYDSIASFSGYSKAVITVFMTLFGINFNVFYLLICKRVKDSLKSKELHTYLLIILSSVILITINIRHLFPSFGKALGAALFQVPSYMTTTGYATYNANDWPNFSKAILLLLMCCGASAGSTGGGFKVARVMLLLKNAKREIKRLLHPRNVSVVTFDGKPVDTEVRHGTNIFLMIYLTTMVVSMLIVSLDNVDMMSSFSGVISALNNIGPGFGKLGVEGNFAFFSPLSKVVFILDMLFGRLELYPMILLFAPIFMHKKKLITKKIDANKERKTS